MLTYQHTDFMPLLSFHSIVQKILPRISYINSDPTWHGYSLEYTTEEASMCLLNYFMLFCWSHEDINCITAAILDPKCVANSLQLAMQGIRT